MLRRLFIGLFVVALSVGALAFAGPSYAQDDYDYDSYDFDYDYDYDYDYEYDTISDEDAAVALFGSALSIGCTLIFIVVFYVVMAFILVTIGKKVGVEEPAWMAWVPLVNYYYMVRVAGLDAWMLILLFVPFVNAFFGIYVWMKIAERRGFPSWYGILLLVPFIGVFVPFYIAWGEPKNS